MGISPSTDITSPGSHEGCDQRCDQIKAFGLVSEGSLQNTELSSVTSEGCHQVKDLDFVSIGIENLNIDVITSKRHSIHLGSPVSIKS